MSTFFGRRDTWVLETLNYKTNGIFVDLGAGNGLNYSSTLLLENKYNWSGLCVESNPIKYDELIKNRNSINKNIVVYNYEGQCVIDVDGNITTESGTTVVCNTFENIFIESGLPNQIDYLSINIGGNELDVIKTINFNTFQIKLICVHHDYYKENMYYKWEIFYYLRDNGFERISSDSYCIEEYSEEFAGQPSQDWYINLNLL